MNPKNNQLHIIHETKHWLVINKPAGIIVEKNPYETSLESKVVAYLQAQRPRIKTPPYVGIVHRLDRVTSGVIVLAKKKSSLKHLNEQFRLRKVQKTYLALTANHPPQKQGMLQHWLLKNQQEKRATIYLQAHKKATKVSLQYHLQDKKEETDSYLLEIKPLTGKFHQIRSQLAAIDCSIMGDTKYGSVVSWHKKIALHAYRLCFQDPISGQRVCFKAKLPTHFKPYQITE